MAAVMVPDRLDVCIISTPKKIMCLLITHRRRVSVHAPAYTHAHTNTHRTADSCAATALNHSFQASGCRIRHTHAHAHTHRQTNVFVIFPQWRWQSMVIKTRNRSSRHTVSGSGFSLRSVNNAAVRRGEKCDIISQSDTKSSAYEHHYLFKSTATRRLDGCQTSGTIKVRTCSQLSRFKYLFTVVRLSVDVLNPGSSHRYELKIKKKSR